MTFAQSFDAPLAATSRRIPHAALRAEWPTRVIVFAPFVTATLLSKFAPLAPGIPPIGLLFPVTTLALGAGLLTGRMQLVSGRFVFFLLMLSVLSLVQVWRGDLFSLTSLAMMAVLGFAYVPAARPAPAGHASVDSAAAIQFFCNLSALIALFGIVQFCLQFVGGTALAFPIETWVPDALRTQGYNDMARLYYGSSIYKANGFVMLEPSVFCQLCALGLIAELASKSRTLRMAVYAGAIVVSYSGTGLVVLALVLPLFVVMYRRWDLLLKGLLLLGVLALLAEPLNLGVTLGRVDEFSSGGSSGFMRFVGWQSLFADRLWNSPEHALLGYGSGTYFDAAVGYAAGEMAHAKIIFEFGVLGALLYFGFIFYCLFGSRAPLILRIAVAVTYFMNGAYSPSVTGFATCLLLWPVQDTAPPRSARRGAWGSSGGNSGGESAGEPGREAGHAA